METSLTAHRRDGYQAEEKEDVGTKQGLEEALRASEAKLLLFEQAQLQEVLVKNIKDALGGLAEEHGLKTFAFKDTWHQDVFGPMQLLHVKLSDLQTIGFHGGQYVVERN